METKPTAVVVHTRLAEAVDAEPAEQEAITLGERLGSGVLHGKDVVEISVLRASKGEALTALRDELGAPVVLYAGDDVTDEHAFEALRDDDVTVKVGHGTTSARYRVDGPERARRPRSPRWPTACRGPHPPPAGRPPGRGVACASCPAGCVRSSSSRLRTSSTVPLGPGPGTVASAARRSPSSRRRPVTRPDDVLAARTWVRRHARWLVASVAVVVGSLAVTQVVLDHREAARVAALAAIPGVVPPVDASIGVLWRADPELAPVLRSGAMVDGVLVGGTQDATGAPAIVGLDPDTGAVAWRTPVDLPTPQPTPTSASPELWISCSERAARRVARGRVHRPAVRRGGPGIPPSSVWVLDPADGELLSDREVDGGWGLTFADGALVVAQPVSTTATPRAPTRARSAGRSAPPTSSAASRGGRGPRR